MPAPLAMFGQDRVSVHRSTFGSALGFITARRIVRPLHGLAAAIEQTPADRLHEALDRDEHDEEVAFLVGEFRA